MLSKPARLASANASATRPGVCVRSSVASTCGTALCMPNEIRLTPAARSRSSCSGLTDSGFASVVTSQSSLRSKVSCNRRRTRDWSSADSSVGVPPPKKTVDSRGAPTQDT